MKRIIALFLALLFVMLSLASCAKTPENSNSKSEISSEEPAEQTENTDEEAEHLNKEGKYPTDWDITEIYASVEDWEKDFERVLEIVQEFEQFKGTLNTAEGVYNYEEFSFGEYYDICMRLCLYTELSYYLNSSDPVAIDCLNKLNYLTQMETTYTSFFLTELFELSLEERQALLKDPILEKYAYALKDIGDPETKVFSEEENNIFGSLSPLVGNEASLFQTFDYVDLPYKQITMPDGTVKDLTGELKSEIMNGDYDRDFKIQTYILDYTRRAPFINTYASLLDGYMRSVSTVSKVQEYENALDAKMKSMNVDEKVFDTVIETANKGIPEYQRYLDIHRRALGYDDLYYFEQKVNSSDFNPGKVTFDEAAEDVKESLAVLGEDYIADLEKILESGHIDAYPKKNKYTGAFSLTYGREFLPYMNFEFDGYAKTVSDIAHECGHSVYSMRSAQNQAPVSAVPTLFTQEVASLTNEFIRYVNRIENAENDDEKIFYLENLLYIFCGNFFVQCEYAEFEDYCYNVIEQGGALSAELLNQTFFNILNKYRGDSLVTFEENAYGWSEIPHFYSSYYVFNYATSVCYAAAICEHILDGDEDVLNGYKEMLTLGNTMSPIDLLAIAGVDPLDQASYDYALEFLVKYVDMYEELVNAKLA